MIKINIVNGNRNQEKKDSCKNKYSIIIFSINFIDPDQEKKDRIYFSF
jgi:hypothetical protein